MLPTNPFPSGGLAAKAFIFVAALILLPAMTIGGVSYLAMEQRLSSSESERLYDQAKQMALESIQAIAMLDGMLDREVREIRAGVPSNQPNAVPGFVGVRLYEREALLLAKADRASRQRLAGWMASAQTGDSSLLEVATGANGQSALFLIKPGPNDQYIVAELDSAFIWPSEKYQFDNYHYCLAAASVVLMCTVADSASMVEAISASLQSAGSTKLVLRAGDSTQMGRVFSIDAFQGISIPVISAGVTMRGQSSNPGLGAFSKPLLALISGSVLLAILISIGLIRRQLRPLNQLSAAVANLEAGNFTDSLQIDTGDEFKVLGTAFNKMRISLGQQFRQLAALSRIDSLVLENADMEKILSAALRELGELMPQCECSLMVFDADQAAVGSVYSILGERVSIVRKQAQAPAVLELLTGCLEDGLRIARVGDGRLQLERIGENLSEAVIAPLIDNQELLGYLCISCIKPVRISDGMIEIAQEFAGRISVATASTRREQRLYIQGHYDELTKLPNRELFRQSLDAVIAARLADGSKAGLLYIDINGFKNINDAEGHSAGDEVLRECARRFNRIIGYADLLARQGGDEFTVLINQLESTVDIDQLCAKISQCIRQPFKIGSRDYVVGASIGVAVVPDDGSTSDALLKNADTAMYSAKSKGGNTVAYYKPELGQRLLDRVRADRELRQAFSEGQFRLHYQPQIDGRTGQIVGAEALMRWEHPERGMVPPFEFISLAEENGLIVEIGAWAIERVCMDYLEMLSKGAWLNSISVNVSAVQINDPQFIDLVDSIVPNYSIPPNVMQFEITESAFMGDFNRTADIFQRLKKRDIQISIDDFGTGYSSLSYLPELEFDVLKLDKSFVANLPDNRETRAVVEAVMTMARGLNKKLVAEGVETKEQEQYLLSKNCNIIQGWLHSKALPINDFIDLFLEKNRPKSRRAAREMPVDGVI